jgi:hypothetical protein
MVNITRFNALEDALRTYRGVPVWLPNPETRARGACACAHAVPHGRNRERPA